MEAFRVLILDYTGKKSIILSASMLSFISNLTSFALLYIVEGTFQYKCLIDFDHTSRYS